MSKKITPEQRELRWLVLSGIMCGLGLGTKYNGIVDFFVLTAFVPVLYAGLKPTAIPIFYLTPV